MLSLRYFFYEICFIGIEFRLCTTEFTTTSLNFFSVPRRKEDDNFLFLFGHEPAHTHEKANLLPLSRCNFFRAVP